VRVAAALARDAADAAAAGLVGPGSLVVVRRPDLAPDALRAHVAQVRAVLAAAGPAHLLAVNADLATAAALGVEAVHLTATRLRALSARPDGFARVGASCHTADELAHAEALGLDWALLGHVHATPSHPEPEARALGWDGFARLAAERTLPVYAIGGLGFGDLDVARRCGAHGVGAIRAAWWPR
jgi:8-oxo-dGTP diphosphatase